MHSSRQTNGGHTKKKKERRKKERTFSSSRLFSNAKGTQTDPRDHIVSLVAFARGRGMAYPIYIFRLRLLAKKKKKKIKKNENTALDSAEWHYFFPSYLPNVVRFIKPQMREMTKRQQLDALKRPTYTRDDTGSFAFARGACILYSMGIWWRIWTRNLVRCSSILIYVGCNNKNN